jgi:hypothetical protein
VASVRTGSGVVELCGRDQSTTEVSAAPVSSSVPAEEAVTHVMVREWPTETCSVRPTSEATQSAPSK